MSVGGNDLGFFEVMNACIFRFYNFYSGTCESALEHAQERLNGNEFEERLRIAILELLNRVKWEKKPVSSHLIFNSQFIMTTPFVFLSDGPFLTLGWL
jgi:hypothetical protein